MIFDGWLACSNTQATGTHRRYTRKVTRLISRNFRQYYALPYAVSALDDVHSWESFYQ
jgi:hypothetical protein